MTAPAFEVKGLSVRYGGVQALLDVDLSVAPGQIVGLIGPNGAGKTTFVDAVTGFAPCTGQVRLDGVDLTELRPAKRVRAGLGRTWQSADLFEDLTVYENLLAVQPQAAGTLFGRGSRNGSSDQLDPRTVLKELGLEDVLDELPATLSHGQRKLVGVARALIGEPRVVLLDEPAAGLDTHETAELASDLKNIAARGMGILLIDHDMGLVFDVVDDTVVLNFGRVIARGTADEIRSNNDVIEAYLGAAHK